MNERFELGLRLVLVLNTTTTTTASSTATSATISSTKRKRRPNITQRKKTVPTKKHGKLPKKITTTSLFYLVFYLSNLSLW